MAASTTKRYANMLVYREGVLLTEENDVKIARDFANKEVFTTALGLAGVTKGAPITKVDIGEAVPDTGVEYDPGADALSATPVQFTFVRGGQSLTQKFVVMTDDTSHAAGGEAKMSFSLIGRIAMWEAF